jgi:hypothetical protein
MEDDEVPHDSIEGALLEGQRFGVRYPEVDAGVSVAGELNHRRGDIDPYDRRAPPSRRGSRVARPGRDVENPHAGAHAGGIQQRIDEVIRYVTEEVVVCRGLTFPAGRLECVERSSVVRDAWLGGYRLVGRRHPISPPAGRRNAKPGTDRPAGRPFGQSRTPGFGVNRGFPSTTVLLPTDAIRVKCRGTSAGGERRPGKGVR